MISGDEREFNLDGSDSLADYCHAMRKEQLVFSKRQQGSKSLMLWRAMSYNEISSLILIDIGQNSVACSEALRDGLLGFAERNVGDAFICQ